MKYIDSAAERLKTKDSSAELSLLERILVSETDPKTAYVLALDLILVGIDTVSSLNYHLFSNIHEKTNFIFQFC